MRLRDDSAETYFYLGELSALQGRDDEAEALYVKAVTLDGKYAEALNALGGLYARHGRPGEAVEYLRRAADLGYGPSFKNLGSAYLQMKEGGRAVEAFERAVAENPKDAAAFLGLGDAHALAGEYPQALDAYGHSLDLDEDQPDAYLGRGKALAALGRKDDAINDLREAMDLFKDRDTEKLWQTRLLLDDMGYKIQHNESRVELHQQEGSNDPALLDQLKSGLTAQGFTNVHVSTSVSRDKVPLIKFFQKGCRDSAFLIKKIAAGVYKEKGGENFVVRDWSRQEARGDTYGLIEVWLPPPAQAGPTPTPAPAQ